MTEKPTTSIQFITAYILVGMLSITSHLVFADDLAKIKSLSAAGATTLALHTLNKQQQSKVLSIEQWVLFERERINIYETIEDWNTIIKRLTDIDYGRWQTSDPDFRNWVNIQLAKAYIESGQGMHALPLLRRLIWGVPGNEHTSNYPLLRRMVIEAYLSIGLVNDAHTAMLRYQQDYGSSGINWKMLRAEVLIRANRAMDAEQLLKGEKHPDAQSLYFLARLKNKSAGFAQIKTAAVRLASQKEISQDTRSKLWVVAANAAEKAGDTSGQITALSQALAHVQNLKRGKSTLAKLLFPVSAKSLWHAYYKYGKLSGNQMQLLTGSDDEWYAAASRLMGQDTLKSRALFAVLASDTKNVQIRKQAHRNFSLLMSREDNAIVLLRQLYLAEGNTGLSLYLPEAVRHQLVDDALSRSELVIASRLIGSMTAPPDGADKINWNLRRARILIMGGNHDQGIEALKALLKNVTLMSRQQVDRLIQVLFDLQAIERHKESIALFKMLESSQGDIQLRREMLYWMADSYKALGKHEAAAGMYLKSVVLLKADAMDPWAQTARYHAADELVKAGMPDDARIQYNMLLKVTKDSGRRAVIRNRLQQLWLVGPAGKMGNQ